MPQSTCDRRHPAEQPAPRHSSIHPRARELDVIDATVTITGASLGVSDGACCHVEASGETVR